MLSLSHNFLFVHVPRTAGNSLQNILSRYSDDEIQIIGKWQDGVEQFAVMSSRYDTRKHSSLGFYARTYGDELFRRLFTFCCVRNPWERCVSHFLWRGVRQWDRTAFLQFVEHRVMPLRFYVDTRDDATRSLGACIDALGAVVRFEALQQDFDAVCVRVGIPIERIPHRNASSLGNYANYYDAKSADVVRARFAEEIEYFGYSRP